ncbi:hypothetical protein Tco_1384176 [Tanacetum coccineum]
MTDLQPDIESTAVPYSSQQIGSFIGSQALSVALDICRERVEKIERNLVERLLFLKDVFVAPWMILLSHEALNEPTIEAHCYNVLSTVVIVPHSGPVCFP